MTPHSHHRRSQPRRAFTLIELLVAIGIIALLAAILIPTITGTMKKAKRTRTAADMGAIKTALDAYKADFGDYPRPEPDPNNNNVTEPDNGFAVLGRALFSPGGATDWSKTPPVFSSPAYVSQFYGAGSCVNYNGFEYLAYRDTDSTHPPSDSNYWKQFSYGDAYAGPGFRIRPMGKVYPSYLQPGKFKLRGVGILDYFGNPILYFPASTKKVNTNVAANSAGYRYLGDTKVLPQPEPVFDAAQNLEFFMRTSDASSRPNAFKRMAALIIRNYDPAANSGQITQANGQIPMAMDPYVLWSAGADDKYGVNYGGEVPGNQASGGPTKTDVEKCDDITTFGQ